MEIHGQKPGAFGPQTPQGTRASIPQSTATISGLSVEDGVELGGAKRSKSNPGNQGLRLSQPQSGGVHSQAPGTYSSGESEFIYSSLNRRRETIKLKKDLPDPKLPSDIRGKFYEQNNYELFSARGPVPADVAQGNLGDCYFLATLASLAQNQPDKIKGMIRDNGDGTFSVRFYAKKSIFHKRKPV